jgi:hypothetical protein
MTSFGLVHEVGQVGAGEPGRAAGEDLQIDAVGKGLVLGVHAEDGLSPLEVGAVDDDLTIEAAGAQQCGVEDVGTVGRRDQDHAGLGVEAVHLHEELVEGLLAFVVTST